ncbi:MAG: alpha/beta hydrolase [Thermoleophilaceae bacterium]
MSREIAERQAELGGLEVNWREASSSCPVVPLYIHGVPNASELWTPFLERTGGIAVDLPGFGRSGKPADFPYSIAGYDRFLEAFTEHLGLERLSLVVHDWGGAALAFAQRFPERIERLVVSNAVPLLPGYRWHRVARVWRTPLGGEMFMGFTFKWSLKLISRESNVAEGPMPQQFIDDVWRHFDHGTQRAILKLYRASPEDVLARAGENLGAIKCPALVSWGHRDPYIPPRFAHDYARALGGEVEVDLMDDAGHWAWYDRPDAIERIARFLTV